MDLVVRESVPGAKGHNVMCEDIKADYKAYLDSVRGTMSITKYIHNLIEQDMKKNKAKYLKDFTELTKLGTEKLVELVLVLR